MPAPHAIPETPMMVELRSLIATLTPVEKAYYLKFASNVTGGKQALHVRLFSFLIKAKRLSERDVQQSLGISSAAQFSALKSHLLTDVLDTLAYMRRHATSQRSLHAMMQHIVELTTRGLDKSAVRLCRKAISIAHACEDHDAVVRLTGLPILNGTPGIDLLQREAASRRDRAAEAHRLFASAEALRADAAIRLSDAQIREVASLEASLRGIRCESSGETNTCLRIEAALASCAYMQARFEESQTIASAVLKLLDGTTQLDVALSDIALTVLSISLYAAFAMKNIDKAVGEITRGRRLATRLTGNRSRMVIETILFNGELKVLHKRTDYAGLKRLLETRAAEVLTAARTVLSPEQGLVLQCSVCISHFVLQNFDEAETLLYEVKDANHQGRREDIMYLSTLFHLLILFEKRDWYRLHAATDAAYHLLYARKKLRPFEKDVMLFLRRLTSLRAGERISHIATFLQKLEAYKTDAVKQLYFLYFDYYGWLRSKVLGLNYQEYRRRELQGTLPEAPDGSSALGYARMARR